MSIITNLKLNQTVVPCVPFIWYREQELTCPFDYIGHLDSAKASILFNIEKDMFVIVQRNISDTNNLYLCLHTILYYELNKTQTKDDLLIVANNFAMNVPFTVIMNPLNDTILKELPNGLKNNQSVYGSVFIHNNAFSPPGCLHFKIDLDKKAAYFSMQYTVRQIEYKYGLHVHTI